MATFEDNNPFASPASPGSSRANSYAAFGGGYPFSPASTSQSHQANVSFDSTNRPTTSSSEDAPAFQYRATNSEFSNEGQTSTMPETSMPTHSTEKEGESCCRVDEILRKNPEMRIVITDAGKASDGGANFIAYTIEVGVRSFCPICG
jgi:hypothetical protein